MKNTPGAVEQREAETRPGGSSMLIGDSLMIAVLNNC